MRLLVVEDDDDLRTVLGDALRQAGFDVTAVADGAMALAQLQAADFDLAIFDLGLPKVDGMTILRSLRRRAADLPVLIVTARDSLEDRVGGLDAGADDYLVKPFDLVELVARVNALLRRHRANRSNEIVIGELRFTPGQPRITLGQGSVDLPVGEFALLEALALRCGRVVRREEIASRLTRNGEPPSDAAIDICVHRLRRRLDAHGLQVRTLRGFGYLLEPVEAPHG